MCAGAVKAAVIAANEKWPYVVMDAKDAAFNNGWERFCGPVPTTANRVVTSQVFNNVMPPAIFLYFPGEIDFG